ncbi:DUF1501 domain-containing protein [Pelagibius sp.]|uniref:DUF1501 domain-containing protein n=1 Tax=Pelagibius sp. TaxID=1931238 RepID=UPI003B50AD54
MAAIPRRSLLKGAAALPLSLALPSVPGAVAAKGRGLAKTLVLVELSGGNDGLNTVVPYADPAYYRSRPKLAIARDRVLQLDETLGLHPNLKPLMPHWQAGELAVVLGLGYPRPNRSHFRSIEIWNTASASEQTLQDGWLHRAITEAGGLPPGLGTLGVVLGGPIGPLAGEALPPVVLKDSRQLKTAARLLDGRDAASANPALDHILAVRRQARDAAGRLTTALDQAKEIKADFPKTPLGRQLRLAAAVIAAQAPAAVIKVQHNGYDTHANQAARHPRLLTDLAASLNAFAKALKRAGAWDRCLVVTYAEFGRRVAQNGSGGTDHGTAAPHFLLGGKLRGGLYGRQPPVGDLQGGDLIHNLDFRQLYATLAQGWLDLPPAVNTFGRHQPLPVIA